MRIYPMILIFARANISIVLLLLWKVWGRPRGASVDKKREAGNWECGLMMCAIIWSRLSSIEGVWLCDKTSMSRVYSTSWPTCLLISTWEVTLDDDRRSLLWGCHMLDWINIYRRFFEYQRSYPDHGRIEESCIGSECPCSLARLLQVSF